MTAAGEPALRAGLVRPTGYVVVELKTGKFQPEYAGKLNFYVALVDDVLRRQHHNETIGILICGTKNCEDWCGWSGTGWQSRCWPFRPVVATQTRTGPRRVPFRRLVRPWGGRPVPARPTSVT